MPSAGGGQHAHRWEVGDFPSGTLATPAASTIPGRNVRKSQPLAQLTEMSCIMRSQTLAQLTEMSCITLSLNMCHGSTDRDVLHHAELGHVPLQLTKVL